MPPNRTARTRQQSAESPPEPETSNVREKLNRIVRQVERTGASLGVVAEITLREVARTIDRHGDTGYTKFIPSHLAGTLRAAGRGDVVDQPLRLQQELDRIKLEAAARDAAGTASQFQNATDRARRAAEELASERPTIEQTMADAQRRLDDLQLAETEASEQLSSMRMARERLGQLLPGFLASHIESGLAGVRFAFGEAISTAADRVNKLEILLSWTTAENRMQMVEWCRENGMPHLLTGGGGSGLRPINGYRYEIDIHGWEFVRADAESQLVSARAELTRIEAERDLKVRGIESARAKFVEAITANDGDGFLEKLAADLNLLDDFQFDDGEG